MSLTGKRWTPEEALKEKEEIEALLAKEAQAEEAEAKLKAYLVVQTRPRKKLGEPMRIYVAGPYSPSIIKPKPTLHDASLYAQRHTDAAIAAAWKLMELGYFPYIPHLSHYVHIQTPEHISAMPGKWWVNFDVAYLSVCDAILMIGDWRNSKGAVSELAYAKDNGMYVFYDIDDVPDTIAGSDERAVPVDVRYIDIGGDGEK